MLLQAVTSFVRVIQLGGKGYAPAESDPLRKHVKGLSDFVHFLDHLEEILGETPDPRYAVQLEAGLCISGDIKLASLHLQPVLLREGRL